VLLDATLPGISPQQQKVIIALLVAGDCSGKLGVGRAEAATREEGGIAPGDGQQGCSALADFEVRRNRVRADPARD